MLTDEYHPEDIKAAIRKRYRSIGRFEVAESLAKGAVADLLRGRKTGRTERAVRRILVEQERWVGQKSITPDSSSAKIESHSLNDRAA